ncbi:MAG: ankyrin repeat domain-containing protein [Proteobacteria bacterium]|nr:ankyrin repeat domain-containing protein [Pseudomonadota bacterium]
MIDGKGLGGITELMHAASLKEPGKLASLLAKSKDGIDDQDDDGLTALHYAALWGFTENVNLLLKAGANPLSKNKHDETPLALAIKNGKIEAVVLLEKAEKEAPLIKPEEIPARVVELEKREELLEKRALELEKTVEELRQQIADMLRKGEVKKTSTPSPQSAPPAPPKLQ